MPGTLSFRTVTFAEYGIPVETPTSTGLAILRGFDTNDRLSDAFTIVAPAGSDIADGDTFIIGDGINTVTFEYDEIAATNGTSGDMNNIPFGITRPPRLTGVVKTPELAEGRIVGEGGNRPLDIIRLSVLDEGIGGQCCQGCLSGKLNVNQAVDNPIVLYDFSAEGLNAASRR